jgi:hypothetical protein
VEDGVYQCIGVFHSSPFTIYCRRRHQTVPKSEKDQMAEPVGEYVLQHILQSDGRIAVNPTKSVSCGAKRTRRAESNCSPAPSDYMLSRGKRACRRYCQDLPTTSGSQNDNNTEERVLPRSMQRILSELSTTGSATRFNLSWMLKEGVLQTIDEDRASSAILSWRRKLARDFEFADELEASLRVPSLTRFLDAVRHRLRKPDFADEFNFATPTCEMMSYKQLKVAFEDLVALFEDEHNQAMLTAGSCSTSPSSSYSVDDGPISPTLCKESTSLAIQRGSEENEDDFVNLLELACLTNDGRQVPTAEEIVELGFTTNVEDFLALEI